jgi:hypothetical protein
MLFRKLSRSTYTERGQALVAALIIVLIITIVGLSFAAMYTGRVRQNTAYVNGYTAQYIAEAGINEFLWVLNGTEGWGNFDKYDFLSQTAPYTFSGYYPNGQGYYYLTATNESTGGSSTPDYIPVTCTGWLKSDPNHKFTINAQLAVQQFTQNLYFTDWEQSSPDGGSQLRFLANGDVLNGPVYTNDVFYINGSPDFAGGPNTAKEALWHGSYGATRTLEGDTYTYKNNPASPNAYYYYCAGTPTGSWPPDLASHLTMPGANSLAQYAKSGGYYFYGRTSICLNADGTMNVCTYDDDQNNYPPDDGQTYGPDDGNTYYTKFHYMTELPLPKNGVIYVDGGSDKNGGIVHEEANTEEDYNCFVGSYNGEAGKFKNDMGNVFVYGTLSGQLTIGAANNIFICGADPTKAYPYPSGSKRINSGVEGVKYNSSTTDMLGLCAGNYVLLMRYDWPAWPGYPVSGTAGNTTDDISGTDYEDFSTWQSWTQQYNGTYYVVGTNDDLPENVNINGVIMTNECFTIEGIGTYNLSDTKDREQLGTVSLNGSLIQEYMGLVEDLDNDTGTVENDLGYATNYSYDARLLSETPPHFLQSTDVGWGVLNWSRTSTPANIPAMSVPVLGQITGNGTGANGLTVTHGYGVSLKLTVPVTPSGACQTVQWYISTSTVPAASIDPYSGYLYYLDSAGSVTVKATSADTSTPVSTTGIVTIN